MGFLRLVMIGKIVEGKKIIDDCEKKIQFRIGI